jgi:hypothetical protein
VEADSQLEQRLRAAAPIVEPLDPDRLIALAGQHRQRRQRRHLALVALAALAILAGVVAFSQLSGHSGVLPAVRTTTTVPRATTTTTSTTTTTTTMPTQTLPPISVTVLPVPTRYNCPGNLFFLSPADTAVGECLPYDYLVGGTRSDPSQHTACPAGSSMTMGPVECDNDKGIVTPVPPGPNTCSTPGGPCPSATMPLPPGASEILWTQVVLPTGVCPAGYYFGEDEGTATCVPFGYLPGGTTSDPNDNTACPAGSGMTEGKLTGTLCVEETTPYDIVAPVASSSAASNGKRPENCGAVSEEQDGNPSPVFCPDGRPNSEAIAYYQRAAGGYTPYVLRLPGSATLMRIDHAMCSDIEDFHFTKAMEARVLSIAVAEHDWHLSSSPSAIAAYLRC